MTLTLGAISTIRVQFFLPGESNFLLSFIELCLALSCKVQIWHWGRRGLWRFFFFFVFSKPFSLRHHLFCFIYCRSLEKFKRRLWLISLNTLLTLKQAKHHYLKWTFFNKSSCRFLLICQFEMVMIIISKCLSHEFKCSMNDGWGGLFSKWVYFYVYSP